MLDAKIRKKHRCRASYAAQKQTKPCKSAKIQTQGQNTLISCKARGSGYLAPAGVLPAAYAPRGIFISCVKPPVFLREQRPNTGRGGACSSRKTQSQTPTFFHINNAQIPVGEGLASPEKRKAKHPRFFYINNAQISVGEGLAPPEKRKAKRHCHFARTTLKYGRGRSFFPAIKTT